MPVRRVLVAGATGRLGRPVAFQLARAGFQVRALTRRPETCGDFRVAGIEVFHGDVSSPDTARAAVRDCDAIYISLRGANDVASYERSELEGVANLAAAARSEGVQRVAYLSGAGRTQGNERHFAARIKSGCEHLILTSGLPYTIFRATHFMESLPLFVRGGAAEVLGRQPHRYHYIAVEDYARMVVTALREPKAANQTFTIFGPEAYTMHEALRIYLSRAHPGMRIKSVPLGLLRVLAALTRNRDLTFAAQLFAAFAAIGEEGDPTLANALLGAPATTLEEWSSRAR